MIHSASDANFGFHSYAQGTSAVKKSLPSDPYYYETYIGSHEIEVPQGDSLFWLSADRTTAASSRGPAKIESRLFAVLIRGFAPENKTSTLTNRTNVPYINGCSTKQIFPPDRPGDPTLQLLSIPPYSGEQAHHIHSTVRAVYILEGQGASIVGMEKKSERHALLPGMVCVLERMCPHHFETEASGLLVLPVHIWSSVPALENNHPMFNGTFRV